jgi:hypothetical protein
MGQRADTMVSISDLDDDRSRRRPQTPAGPPAWSGWLQIGLSTMLAVLFLVMLAKTREQNQLLRQLEQRVQGLENSRALDRTSVLEEQQRAMLQRLQPLEAGARRLEADLQNRARRRPEPSLEPVPSPPMPSPAAGGKSAPSQTPRGDGGVLRPPAPGSP